MATPEPDIKTGTQFLDECLSEDEAVLRRSVNLKALPSRSRRGAPRAAVALAEEQSEL